MASKWNVEKYICLKTGSKNMESEFVHPLFQKNGQWFLAEYELIEKIKPPYLFGYILDCKPTQ